MSPYHPQSPCRRDRLATRVRLPLFISLVQLWHADPLQAPPPTLPLPRHSQQRVLGSALRRTRHLARWPPRPTPLCPVVVVHLDPRRRPDPAPPALPRPQGRLLLPGRRRPLHSSRSHGRPRASSPSPVSLFLSLSFSLVLTRPNPHPGPQRHPQQPLRQPVQPRELLRVAGRRRSRQQRTSLSLAHSCTHG